MDGHHHHQRSTRSALTLSQKQYAKITGTIASVRKQREIDTRVLYSNGELGHDNEQSFDSNTSEEGEENYVDLEETSFVAEESFIRAPLNPRVSGNVKRQQNMHFSKRDKYAEKDSAPDGYLDTLSIEVQEALILEELLSTLMGVPGAYITCDSSLPDGHESLKGVEFVVSQSLDPSLRDLVERILPLATSYTAVKAFIQQRSNLENGLVNHALCASMRMMLKDYHTLIIQLEHAFNTDPYFSLQKFWFYVHPTLHTLSLLQTLTRSLIRRPSNTSPSDSDENSDADSDSSSTRARNAELGLAPNLNKIVKNMSLDADLSLNSSLNTPPKGGEVLTTLSTLLNTHAGDPRACLVYGILLRDASLPYARILLKWVKRGHLEDPYEEFMVRESRAIDRGILERDYVDEYWERRYTLRDGSTSSAVSNPGIGILTTTTIAKQVVVARDGACIPPLLEPWKHKILLAGKYLNVIRECAISVDETSDKKDENDVAMDDERFLQIISYSYTHANKTLLHLLLHTHQLLPRLRTLHHFFFLSRSFYLTHFFDIASNELKKPVKGANIAKLGTLLSVAVNADDVGAVEVGRDDVKLIMQSTSLVEWLIKISSVKGAPLVGEPDEWLEREKERGTDREKNDKDKSKSALTVVDLLSLDYTPPFPLSLVISRKAVLRYQLIFRFLLSLKYLEYQLCNMWVEQKGAVWRIPLPPPSQSSGKMTIPGGRLTPIPATARAPTPMVGYTRCPTPSSVTYSLNGLPPHPALLTASQSLTQWRAALLALRGQMLAVVRHLLSFTLYSVLEVHWRSLEKKLSAAERGSEEKEDVSAGGVENCEAAASAGQGTAGGRNRIETVDQLLRDHVDFLDTCLKECMLSSSRLVKQHHRLLQTCTAFSWYTSTFAKSLAQGVIALETLQAQLEGAGETGDPTVKIAVPAPMHLKMDDIDKAMKTRWEFLERFKSNFGHWLKSYIEFVSFHASSENAALMPLVGRLKSVVGVPPISGFATGSSNEEGRERFNRPG
ncbi:hypothetical protein Clacol_007317 [Clathrus columnatus]|uniref:Spindle pole body component n=1 Tax=Clathrus columnatus TaxID=1419009 RepID=A0AAV5AHT5_9AGAM|nr:hypothetical protein Clacol_007317 [Clathrus columnatus]